MDYEIINKEDIPMGGYGQNLELLNKLEVNKAALLIFSDKKIARHKALSLCGSARIGRLGFQLHYRILPNGEEFNLYVWRA